MEILHATAPLRVGHVVLIPVQRVRVERWDGGRGTCVSATAEPRAVLVREEGGWRALDAGGAEVPLEPLLEEVPGLADAVTRASAPAP